LNFEKALSWLQKGAQPTDTCRSILSHEGVMMKKHLLGGVAKGAFSESDAEAKFNKWVDQKNEKKATTASKLAGDVRAAEKARAAAETKVKEEKAAAIAAKKAEAVAVEEVAEEVAEEVTEEVAEVAEEVAEAPAEVAEVAEEKAAE
jgi:small subunit ribosomal protein S16